MLREIPLKGFQHLSCLFPALRLPASRQRPPPTPAVPGQWRPPPWSPDGAREGTVSRRAGAGWHAYTARWAGRRVPAPREQGALCGARSPLFLRQAGFPTKAARRCDLEGALRLLGTWDHGQGGRKHALLASSLSSPSLVQPGRAGGEPSFSVVGARDPRSGSGRERAGRAPGPLGV